LYNRYTHKQNIQLLSKKYSDKLKESEDTLRSQNLQFDAELEKNIHWALISQQSQNAIMLMDAKGNILRVNNSFTRMYEYTYNEFISALGNNIRKTSFNPLIHERLNRCIHFRESVTYEALNITKSGKEIWTHTSLIPLVCDNVVVGLATIDSDIHNRIKTGEYMSKFIVSFNEKISNLSEQLNVLVDLTNALFERIEISQKRMNRTEQILMFNREISDKIRILGLNASIEAHASGNAGVGFRVIANEVVSISNNMLGSLREISELVSSVKRTSDKLGTEKERSLVAISKYQNLITELKNEINSVENMVLQMN
jgi:PAS domain S-box-containing protein